VAPARRWAAALAAARGASPGDARIITSELVTNAIQFFLLSSCVAIAV
jgi:hypothetical protein